MVLKGLVITAYVLMIVFNGLANTLPLGGRTTGEVSDRYPSLFTPAGFTFSIWGVIYLVLLVFVIAYLLDWYGLNASLQRTIGWLFVLSALLNVAWLWMWHHDRIVLSTVVMIALFAVLMIAFLRIDASNFWLRVPFSLYFAWICVALIANVTIMLVALDAPLLGLREETWLIMVLVIAAAIGIVTVLTTRDVAFGLVFIWAFAGILSRHVSAAGLNMAYPSAVSVLSVFIVALIVTNVYCFIANGMNILP